MQVNHTNTGAAAAGSSTSDTKKIDDAFAALLGGGEDDAATMIGKITKDGLKSMWSWQLEELKKKVAAEVMQSMGVTRESLSAMPDDERAALEKKIMDEVERRMKEMVDNEMKKKNPLAGISPGVDAGTMQGLLTASGL